MSYATLVDREYETIVDGLNRTYRNVDPYLLIKSAMLRKKYPGERKQHFWLDIYYKEDANHSNKGTLIFSKVGRLLSYHGHNHYTIDIQASLDTVLSLASDTDIERIDGEVFPISS
jgi:hypothetical protein